MDRRQINSLVTSYQNGGDELVLRDIVNIVTPLIERTSRELEFITTDFTKFDCRMILKVKKVVETFNEDKDDFISIVKTLISREKSDFIRRRRKKMDEQSMQALESPGNEESSIGYQFEDPLAGVEEEVLFKEKIALLAEGDSRKKMVLLQWSKGATDKSISELLAQLFGGKSESHRKFIARFKTACREVLTEMDELHA